MPVKRFSSPVNCFCMYQFFVLASEDILRLQITGGFNETLHSTPVLNTTEIIPWAQVNILFSL